MSNLIKKNKLSYDVDVVFTKLLVNSKTPNQNDCTTMVQPLLNDHPAKVTIIQRCLNGHATTVNRPSNNLYTIFKRLSNDHVTVS